jgi:hypothetical protein
MIPNPLTDGRLLVALGDFINPKTGKKIFGCAHIFDHAAKANQSKYPWAQNVVLIGLLKHIKGRWACLPLAHRFYLPQKAIASKLDNMDIPGEATFFHTKLEPHLKKRKPKPCKEVMGEISGFSWPDEYLEGIADLNKMVGKYKFKEAGDVLEGMIKGLRK